MTAFKDSWPRKTTQEVREEGHRLFIATWIVSLTVFGVHKVIFSEISGFTTLFVVFMQLKTWNPLQRQLTEFTESDGGVLFCFYCKKKKKQQNFPLRHPSASPRLCLPLSMAAAPVVTSCRCRTPAAWWTCKQHGHSYIFPSGRLGAVSTILFTLWIPRTRSRPAPLFLGSPFWRVRWCCVCLRVRGVEWLSVAWRACMWCLTVLRRLEPAMELKQPRSEPPSGKQQGETIEAGVRRRRPDRSSNLGRRCTKRSRKWSLLATCVTLYDVAANCLWQLAHL